MRMLDLFCYQGGAAMGYMRAGYEVVGVDLDGRAAKRYPGWFHQGDAIEFVKAHGHEFDVIHASPPCQHASAGTRAMRARGDDRHPALIGPTREALIATGKPYVIENVSGAELIDPLLLCWSMFYDAGSVLDDDGTPLRMERHRLFESNVLLYAPMGRGHEHDRTVQVAGSYGGARRDKREAREVRHGGYVPSKAVQERLLGIGWMTQHGLHQALPPVYTEWIGRVIAMSLAAS